jgi:hypothetical protein
MSLESAVRLAGLGQLALAAASTAIPYVLRWKTETAALRPLLRQLFWVYAGYILGFHIAFGLVSALAPEWLLDGSGLATAVAGFIATYWSVRLVLQFAYLDRSDAPKGPWFSAAEAALVSLFVSLSVIYTCAFLTNLAR